MRGEEFMSRKALDCILFKKKICGLNPLDMRTIVHTWTDKAPVQCKQLGGGERNGRRSHKTPNFLEADLARVYILN